MTSRKRQRVVLYNPRAVFWTMPLALIAIGSALDRSRYDVVIVDGRLESDPLGSLLAAIDESTVCLGITVLTGAPIRDALSITRAVKAQRPDLPIVWGGWHPSLFAEQCMREQAVDAIVIGQGEDAFAELVDRFAEGGSPTGIAGSVHRDVGGRAGTGPIVHELLRPMRDVNELASHDYRFVDVDRYFAAKGRRQFDYISSQGCRFRCTFCADPYVYKRGWYGLEPERMATELLAHKRAFGFDEVAFQDETFFTSRSRVAAVAEAFLTADLRVTWTATMRADQGYRLDEELLELCRRAGLKRVMIGVESGSPEMLKRIQKDITIEQVFVTAERCVRQGIGAICNFIVGFPGESDESMQETLDVAARLRAMSTDFEAAIFYYRPYPGNPLADELLRDGYVFPDSLEGWGDFDYVGGYGEWVTPAQHERVERFKFYQRYAFGHNRRALRRPLQRLSRWRVDRGWYALPLEKAIIERLKPAQRLS
jgi:anaerobic magnesium-protoporphyrin IX monomethyl ester cyclase